MLSRENLLFGLRLFSAAMVLHLSCISFIHLTEKIMFKLHTSSRSSCKKSQNKLKNLQSIFILQPNRKRCRFTHRGKTKPAKFKSRMIYLFISIYLFIYLYFIFIFIFFLVGFNAAVNSTRRCLTSVQFTNYKIDH